MNEESRYGGEARVNEAFHSLFGFVELLNRIGSIIVFVVGVHGRARHFGGHVNCRNVKQ